MKAAVLRAYNTPVEIEDLEVSDPGPREVRVRTRACGVCHSDLHVFEGSLPVPIPTVLGHEPAGVVEEVGSLVKHVAPGDRVIACLSVFCGDCRYCHAGKTYLCGGLRRCAPARTRHDSRRTGRASSPSHIWAASPSRCCCTRTRW